MDKLSSEINVVRLSVNILTEYCSRATKVMPGRFTVLNVFLKYPIDEFFRFPQGLACGRIFGTNYGYHEFLFQFCYTGSSSG